MRNSKLPGFRGHSHEYEVPDHTQEALEGYLLKGWEPGGFVSAMLAMDMERALYAADMVNKKFIWSIGRWICDHAPDGSWGNYELIKDWCDDKDGRRSAYANHIEKEYVARVLKEGV